MIKLNDFLALREAKDKLVIAESVPIELSSRLNI
jgi:hypothetical protein